LSGANLADFADELVNDLNYELLFLKTVFVNMYDREIEAEIREREEKNGVDYDLVEQ
jgi:hypothetical protein